MKMTRVNAGFKADGVFHSDPGHGWLAVKLSELERLELMDKITSYSYQSGEMAYLEEDCDMSTYFQKLEENGVTEYKFFEIYQEETPIRNFQCFDGSFFKD